MQEPTPALEASTYIGMLSTIQGEQGHLSVVIYTQITDVELEVLACHPCPISPLQCDGFLNYDRRCIHCHDMID